MVSVIILSIETGSPVKQCRPRSDATESGFTLFAMHTTIF